MKNSSDQNVPKFNFFVVPVPFLSLFRSMASNTNILWIDCEMTGLNPYLRPADLPEGEVFLSDRILEVRTTTSGVEM